MALIQHVTLPVEKVARSQNPYQFVSEHNNGQGPIKVNLDGVFWYAGAGGAPMRFSNGKSSARGRRNTQKNRYTYCGITKDVTDAPTKAPTPAATRAGPRIPPRIRTLLP